MIEKTPRPVTAAMLIRNGELFFMSMRGSATNIEA